MTQLKFSPSKRIKNLHFVQGKTKGLSLRAFALSLQTGVGAFGDKEMVNVTKLWLKNKEAPKKRKVDPGRNWKRNKPKKAA